MSEYLVPQHLIERSAARRAALALRPPIAPSEQMAKLGLGQILAESLVVGEGIPECSIAASDTAAAARELMDVGRFCYYEKQPGYYSTFYTATRKSLQTVDEGFQKRSMRALRITPDFQTRQGATIHFALTEPAPPEQRRRLSSRANDTATPNDTRITMFAITRDNLAFPVVRFTRSSKEYCDHLQFFGEDRMDEFESQNFYGWGLDDQGSRFETVEAIKTILDTRTRPDTEARLTHLQNLAAALKLELRMAQEFGEIDTDIEKIMEEVFGQSSADGWLTFKHEYKDVSFGKVNSDLTIEGTMAPPIDKPHVREFSVRQYPSSQPDREWHQKTFMIDQRGTILAFDETEARQASAVELSTILELLNHQTCETTQAPTQKSSKQEILGIPSYIKRRTYFLGVFAGNLATNTFLAARGVEPAFLVVPASAAAASILYGADRLIQRNKQKQSSNLQLELSAGYKEE